MQLQTVGLTVSNVVVTTNGLITHMSGQNNKVSLTLSGDLTINLGAAITASQRGYGQNLGPGAGTSGTGQGGSHAGQGGLNTNGTYGSFLTPATAGSGADYTPGGGVVDLNVAGQATVNGAIDAGTAYNLNGGTGAGGSIRLRTRTLSGTGRITASTTDGGGYAAAAAAAAAWPST